MSSRLVTRVLLSLIGEIILCAVLNRFDDWTLEQNPVRFVTTAMLAGVAFFAATSSFPVQLKLRHQALLFWSATILLRLIVLPLEPGDDFWRYQWEGKIQRAGFNPYLHAPDDEALVPLRTEFTGWHKINHRDFRAIYPPGAQIVFRLLSALSDSPFLYKLIFTAADLGAVLVLLRLIPPTTRYADAAWYAWNPLVVYSFAGSAHFDSLMILPMLGAILCLTKFEALADAKKRWRLAFLTGALFGISISIKLVPLLLLPLVAFALRKYAVALLVSLALPGGLSVLYGFPQVPIWDSLRRFAYVTRLNDIFWWVIEETVWPNPRQKNYQYNFVIVIVVLILSLVFWRNWRRGMLWVMGATLFFSPVFHPWYCTWILPLAAWRRVEPWQVLSVTLFAYFLFWNERLFLLPWRSEMWLRGIILIPPLIATLFYFARRVEKPAIAAS